MRPIALEPRPSLRPAAAPAAATCAAIRHVRLPGYARLLTWAFTFFSATRVISYAPTLLAIVQSGDSSQHSLLTWVTWLGANLTMAAWLHEQDRALNRRAVAVSLCNAVMCLLTLGCIGWYRL